MPMRRVTRSVTAPDAVGDRRRRSPSWIELGAAQRPHHAVAVRAEREHRAPPRRRARGGAPRRRMRLPVATRGRHAVHRPGDGLEQRGLAGAVGSHDARQAAAEHELGVLVLPEVDEAQAMDDHGRPRRRSRPARPAPRPAPRNARGRSRREAHARRASRAPPRAASAAGRARPTPVRPRCGSGRRRSRWKCSAAAFHARICAWSSSRATVRGTSGTTSRTICCAMPPGTESTRSAIAGIELGRRRVRRRRAAAGR